MHSNFTIIKDTREKDGWNFEFYDNCKGVEIRGLKTGDYTVEGLEESLCIERKASTAEISTNLGKERKRFEAELERMSKFSFSYILCEFSCENLMEFPKNSTIPYPRWKYLRMNGKRMYSLLRSYEENYGIEVVFCNNKNEAELKAMEIFNSAISSESG